MELWDTLYNAGYLAYEGFNGLVRLFSTPFFDNLFFDVLDFLHGRAFLEWAFSLIGVDIEITTLFELMLSLIPFVLAYSLAKWFANLVT